ncbi:MAG: 30S ribosomal protein S12 methylthiotransferase RimO [Candidatus Omnitrophica bacterium]|nr:30S ribosomal protein S12 methylthiotransferase RimO [Candidatus Omnitrophota bacterium]
MSHSQPLPIVRRIEDLEDRTQKVFIVSLGCPKNLVDTERHLALLAQEGYRLVHTPEEADLLLVNTCSFIDTAKKESVDAILEMVDLKSPGQSLGVAGCLVDRYPEELRKELPEVDLWLDTNGFQTEKELLHQLGPAKNPTGYVPLAMGSPSPQPQPIPWAGFSRVSLTPKHTAYLKISEGCDHSCSFCSIPSFKGKHRSVPIDLLIQEAEALVSAGAKELTLIGQDIISYGKDLSRDRSLNIGTLLSELNRLDGLAWIRLLYTYPTRLADELESAYSQLDKMIPYLDLPLQHLSDSVLQRMRRGTPYDGIRSHIERLRRVAPNLVVRSTCIVGFPGETEEDYLLLKERFLELGVDHLGVFRYSDEEGTPAVDEVDKVPIEIAEERHEEMTEWAARLCHEKATERVGSKVRILIDRPVAPPVELFDDVDPSGHWFEGRWYGQAPEIDGVVYFQHREGKAPGEFVEVLLEETSYPDYRATTL